MAQNEIIIRIINEVVTDDEYVETGRSSQGSGNEGIKGKTLLAGGVKLLAASGQTEMASIIGTAGKYWFLEQDTMKRDPDAIAGLAFNLAASGIEFIKKEIDRIERERKEEKNFRYALLRYNLVDFRQKS